MNEWKSSKLGELSSVNIGGTPSRTVEKYWAKTGQEDGVSWVAISDMKRRFIEATKESITPLGANNSNVKLVKAGTLMMSFKLSLGKMAFASKNLYTNEAIASFEIDESKVDKVFLYYQLSETVKSAITDTAIKGVTLNKEKLNTLLIRHPSLQKQRGIAAILSSIDDQIDTTQTLIDKYTLIKQGMMADLFNRGIDTSSGQLRPSFEEAPELYHKTDLGWLPKGWSTPTLESLLADVNTPMRSGPFGSALLKHELVQEGIPLLGIDNIFVEEFRSSYKRFVTAKKFQELSRYAVKPKDVVITIMGTVGRTCVVPDNLGRALSSKHLWTMTFDQARIIPELVCWQLNHSEWVDSWFRKESQGGVMEAIQSQTLRQLKLVLPPEVEQKKIHEMYSTLNGQVDSNLRELAKLKLQKQGLMQDLLTGKVSIE